MSDGKSTITIPSDLIDQMDEVSSKLAGLLIAISGDNSNHLSQISGTHLSNVLWLASDMASDLKKMVNQVIGVDEGLGHVG